VTTGYLFCRFHKNRGWLIGHYSGMKMGSGTAMKGAHFAGALALVTLATLPRVEVFARQSLRFFAVDASHAAENGNRHHNPFQAFSKELNCAKRRRLSQRQRSQQEVEDRNERPCGSVIDVISANETVQLATTFISAVFTPAGFGSLVSVAMEPIIAAAQYDLQVVKVCGTCASIVGLHPTTFNTEKDSALFQSYCGPDAYGVADSMVNSAIALVPVEASDSEEGAGGRIPVLGKLRTLINMRATRVDVNDAATVSWPDRFASLFGNSTDEQLDLLLNYLDYFAAITSASTGAVTIFPDGIGTLPNEG
jgi:hypothetical protein